MKSPEIHFIISAPRSGSTWLASALNQHPEIFATEHRLFGNFCEMWPNNNGNLAPRITFDAYAHALSVHYFHKNVSDSRAEFIEQFTAEYAEFLIEFARRKSGKRVIVDKITPYPGTSMIVVEQIRRFFPESKVIKLLRDGRDVLTSGAFDWLLKDAHGTPRFRHFVEKDSSIKLTRFFDDDLISKWAANWTEVLDSLANVETAQTVRYENMLSGMPGELQKLFQLLLAKSDMGTASQCAAAVEFERSTGRPAGVLEPTAKQRSGVSGDWQNYFVRQDGELFDTIAGKHLLDEGYAADTHWIDELPDQLTGNAGINSHGASHP